MLTRWAWGRLLGALTMAAVVDRPDFSKLKVGWRLWNEARRRARRGGRGRQKFLLVVRAKGQRPLAVVDLADFAALGP